MKTVEKLKSFLIHLPELAIIYFSPASGQILWVVLAVFTDTVTGVFMQEIRNDLQLGASDSAALANIIQACQNATDQGFDVFLIIPPPSTGGTPVGRTQAEMETSRLWVRSQLLGDFPTSIADPYIYLPTSVTYALCTIDLGDPSTIMGNVANCSNLTYYQDGTHPTATGHSLMAPPIINAAEYYLTLNP